MARATPQGRAVRPDSEALSKTPGPCPRGGYNGRLAGLTRAGMIKVTATAGARWSSLDPGVEGRKSRELVPDAPWRAGISEPLWTKQPEP